MTWYVRRETADAKRTKGTKEQTKINIKNRVLRGVLETKSKDDVAISLAETADNKREILISSF